MTAPDSPFVLAYDDPIVVVCDGSELPAVEDYVRAGLAGELSAPLFMVGPNVDPAQAHAEIAHAGYPVGTGLLMRTSGSTSGTGTIVPLSWHSLRTSAHATHQALYGPGRWLADLPLHHIAGFQTIVRSVLAGVAPLHQSLTEVLPSADASQPTYCSVVPTQLRRILADSRLTTLARSVVLLVGGAATPSSLLAQTHDAGLTVHTSYGMTETCGGCVYDGRPIGDAVIELSDSGQISITGAMVTGAGLLTASAQSCPLTATYHTRDHGRFNADGTLSVLGRIDDAITTGGLTIIPHLVEEKLEQLTGMRAIVVGVPDQTWGESAVAILEPGVSPLSGGAEKQIRDHIKHSLGTGWQPRWLVPLATLGYDSWPLKDSGKIDRRAITAAARLYFSCGNS
ncbi:AMP-binding protein [Arcanobacterium phocae]|uniref:AMP-binding protein n=1 Tax=Arcanobacterium phocae TaxID=131112 RepID=UPI001C0E9EE6|nr:AMP-binding protein [Arcanobacterium phocae]